MKKKTFYFVLKSFLFLSLFIFFITTDFSFGEDRVLYPKGYRDWHHVKSMLIYDQKHPLFNQFGGIHHIYVNKKGLEAYKKGEIFPDGTVNCF